MEMSECAAYDTHNYSLPADDDDEHNYELTTIIDDEPEK